MSKRWLVVGPSWVGDMVMTQCLFKRLKAQQPDCTIDVVAPAWSVPILARMPEVNEAVVLDVKHGEWGWSKRLALGKQLRDRYTHAIVIPRSFKAALLPFFAEIPERIAYRGEMRFVLINDMRMLDKRRLPLAVQRFVALGEPAEKLDAPEIDNPSLTLDEDNQQRFLTEHGLSLDKPVVALLPGAEFGPAKQWPEENWVSLADSLAQRGYQLWCLGSPKDADVAERIADQVEDETARVLHNFCGKTRLEDAVDLLALAEHAVTNDSGLMHVAAAVGSHVVAIYRTTTPAYTPPLTDRYDILRADLNGQDELMGVRQLPENHGIIDVTPEQVLALI